MGAQQLPINNSEELTDHSDMHILDFQPSLKTLSILAVSNFKLDCSILPQSLKYVTKFSFLFTILIKIF